MAENEFIHVYSRREAIADGVQIELPKDLVKEAGFTIPIFITQTAYNRYAAVPKGMENTQDLNGRIWDILNVIKFYAKKNPRCDRFDFNLIVQMPDAGNWIRTEKLVDTKNRSLRKVIMVAAIEALDFDNDKLCITISMPGED